MKRVEGIISTLVCGLMMLPGFVYTAESDIADDTSVLEIVDDSASKVADTESESVPDTHAVEPGDESTPDTIDTSASAKTDVISDTPTITEDIPTDMTDLEADFLASFTDEEEVKIAEVKLPDLSAFETAETTLLSLDVPLLGTLNLEPFTDTTQTPPESGFKIVFADKSKKVSLGALEIDEGQLQFVQGKIGMTGQATLLDNRARFGIKDIDFVAEKKFIKRILLGVDFINKPSFEIIPGVPDSRVELTTAEIEIERDKPVILRSIQNVFGQKVIISFYLEADHVNASLKLANVPLSTLITAVEGTPLATAQVKDAGLDLKNLYAKNRADNKFTVIIAGKVDLTPTQLSDEPQAVSDLSLTCSITSASVEGTIAAQRFPLADIGVINQANITIKAGTAAHEKQENIQEQEKVSISLSGDLTFTITDTGTLDITVASKISNRGLEFLGELKQPFSYAGITMSKGKVLFDTTNKVVDIVGDVTFEGLNLLATFAVKPDPVAPLDKTKRTLEFTAKVKADKFEPFSGTDIPVLNTLSFTNLDARVEVIKAAGKPLSKAIVLDGDVHILNVSMRSLIKFVVNDKGQKGVYINAPLPQNWTFSQSIPALQGPVFDGLVFEEASFVASTVDYTDTDKNVTITKGLQFYAKVPLAGTLEPVAKLIGSSQQKFTMFGTITPDNPRAIVFGIKLGENVPLGTAAVEIGDTELVIKGTPALGLKANVIVRPSPSEQLHFSGEFKLDATEASLDVGMAGLWKNPFGINGLSLSDTYLTLGIKYGAPLPTKFGIAAKMAVSSTNTIAFAVVADAGMEHMALKGSANKLSFMELITAFARPMGVNIPDPNVPILDLRDVDVRFAATDTHIGNELIEQGVTMRGKMDLLGQEKAAELDVNVDLTGIKIKGYAQPINLQGLLKVSGLSGQESPCNIRIEGGSGQDRPEVDIELTLARQVFLVQGAMVLGSESNGVFYKTASCMTFSRAGIAFEFLSQIGSNKLLYSRVQGKSSGLLSNPQFELSIDFEQHLQQFIKDQVNTAFSAAQQQIVQGINTAQEEINKIDSVIEDSNKKIREAEAHVAAASKSLQEIDNALDDSNKAFADAQKEIDTIEKDIDNLTKWWNGLPDY